MASMASKLRNRKKSNDDQDHVPDRRESCSNDDGDEFSSTSAIATKINSRRLPRRTPTTHVKSEDPKARSERSQRLSESGEANRKKPSRQPTQESLQEDSENEDATPPQKPVAVSTSKVSEARRTFEAFQKA